VLSEQGWRVNDKPKDVFAGYSDGSRIPDLYGTKRIKGKMVRMVVEIETHPRPDEMKARIVYYTDTMPTKADRFVEIPLYTIAADKWDSFSALRELVEGCL